MAKTSSNPHGDRGRLEAGNVSDQVVSQVGKAALEVAYLRRSLESDMAQAQTEAERHTLADEAEDSAVRAIGEHGLTVTEYNEVIAAAQSDPELEQRVLLAARQAD